MSETNTVLTDAINELGVRIFTDALMMASQVPNDDHAETVLDLAGDVMEGLAEVRTNENPRAALETLVAKLETAPHERNTNNTTYRETLPADIVREVYNSTMIDVTRKLLEV